MTKKTPASARKKVAAAKKAFREVVKAQDVIANKVIEEAVEKTIKKECNECKTLKKQLEDLQVQANQIISQRDAVNEALLNDLVTKRNYIAALTEQLNKK